MKHVSKVGVYLGVFLLAMLLANPGFAQETTGGIQGTIKDQTGAIIAGATVEVTSSALIGTKSLQTDASGFYRFVNLPIGEYTLTVTAPNFKKHRQTGINLDAGRMPTIDVALEIGAVTSTVEVSAEATLVDVTQSKVQTNVNELALTNLPLGRSYQSVIQFAPGARSEPLQAGFQIDGASNSENSYLVEGQETSDIRSGASNVNVPREFIQEVQIKSSGFEAEYGGALGGVVNVIMKRGGNTWHGSVFTYYQADVFDSQPNKTLRKNPSILINAGGATRLDQPAQYYSPKQDHYRYIDPGFEVGGKLIQDRLWVFTSFVPRILNTRRTVNFLTTPPIPNGPISFNQQAIVYYGIARADVLATQKIRVFGSWQTNYVRVTGNSLPGVDDVAGLVNTSATSDPRDFSNSIGYVQPRVIFGVGADMTLLPTLVATTRFGRLYSDYQDRGVPVGNRYIYRDTNYPYSTGTGTVCASPVVAPCTVATTALSGATLLASDPAIHSANWSNMGANSATVFDRYERLSFSQDVAYFAKFYGTHNLKAGYGFSRLQNNVTNGYNTADIYVAFGVTYAPGGTTGITNCNAIIATNTATYGNPGGTVGSDCQGLWGTVNIRDLGTAGKVGSWNHALYMQDSWTVARGLTLNLGVRFDKEKLPSYNPLFRGINFGFTDKVAPRLGAAWDVLGNGKIKVSGSYAWFYDIMKYELPRGSFGGDYWHDCVYALDTTNFAGILPVRDAQNHYCPLTGGANGTLPAGLRFIENYDYRMPSNDPSTPGGSSVTGLVDPNLKPMKQNAVVLGAEWAIMPTLLFEARYTRKRIDRTIEDTGIITPAGEQYFISNPGFGVNATVPAQECTGCPPNPKANRRYDAVEFRLTKRGGAKWFGSLSYTYSKLRGNYSGLTATDISDGGAGRNSPNVDRAFDGPQMGYTSHGKVDDGPLATDRPNTFKGVGYYTLKWWDMETTFGGFQQLYQGTPLSSYVSVNGAPVFVEGRGKFVAMTRDAATGNWVQGSVSSRRTPIYSQTDVSVAHSLHVSKSNEALKIGFEIDVFNLFNQKSTTYINQNLIRTSYINPTPCTTTLACPATNISGIDYKALLAGYNYVSVANTGATATSRILNSLYGMPYGWQSPREVRFKVKFTF